MGRMFSHRALYIEEQTLVETGDWCRLTRMKTFTMAIAGMTCSGCVKAVQKAIGSVTSATADDVTIGSATVSFDEWLTSETAVSAAIRKAGFSTPDHAG